MEADSRPAQEEKLLDTKAARGNTASLGGASKAKEQRQSAELCAKEFLGKGSRQTDRLTSCCRLTLGTKWILTSLWLPSRKESVMLSFQISKVNTRFHQAPAILAIGAVPAVSHEDMPRYRPCLKGTASVACSFPILTHL